MQRWAPLQEALGLLVKACVRARGACVRARRRTQQRLLWGQQVQQGVILSCQRAGGRARWRARVLPPVHVLWALYHSKIILHLLDDTGQADWEEHGHSASNVSLNHLRTPQPETNCCARPPIEFRKCSSGSKESWQRGKPRSSLALAWLSAKKAPFAGRHDENVRMEKLSNMPFFFTSLEKKKFFWRPKFHIDTSSKEFTRTLGTL